MTSTNDFPTTGVKLRYLLVASDYARSLAFYCDVLGATVIRQISDVLCLLNFGDSEFLLTVGGGPTTDKPTVTFAPPIDPNTVSSELNIRVPDCYDAYEVLRSRGAEFLMPPVDWGYEVRAFFRDPDGHLLELTQSGQQKNQAGEHV
ncbi:MAG TPA: VOC family protein [Ktedonobacteraceae bacterium]|nr:VOC family protein [Ktedonobacteraceae bacterium]